MAPYFDIVQNRGWKDDHLFRVWTADDAIKGVFLRSSGGWGRGIAAGSSSLAEISIVFVVWLLILFVVALHMMIFFTLRDGGRQQKQKRRLETFDSQSDEFLGWDARNFRLGRDEVVGVEMIEPKTSKRQIEPSQSVRVHLRSGAMQQWTFANRQLAQQFREEVLSNSALECTVVSAVLA